MMRSFRDRCSLPSSVCSRRAQISLEFLAIASFAVLLLVSLLALATDILGRTVTESTLTSMSDITASVHQELLTAYTVGDGYSRIFAIPSSIQSRNYALNNTVDGNSSVITLTVAHRSLSVRTPACTGPLKPGTNRIRTANGNIWCNQ